MIRTAKCHCGQLQLECEGDPSQVIMCHCELCQRRTGTSFNLGAWFESSKTTLSGRTKEYVRTGDQGIEIVYRFCPECGTSLCWDAPAFFPDMLAVAAGCFTDPAFPAPTLSIYGKRRHQWLPQPPGFPSHTGFIDSPEE